MTVMQRVVPIVGFAGAMLRADGSFAERVRAFERTFGPAQGDTLALLAQAAYFCWGNQEHRRNLEALCAAVRAERPTWLYLHRQVSPARWAELHAYVVGVQRWLGREDPPPAGLDGANVVQIGELLGEREPAREALAQLALGRLVSDLLALCLARLGGEPDPEGYADFSAWYVLPDGSRLDDGWFGGPEHREHVRRRVAALRPEAMGLVDGIARESPPPCVHRFTRYVDIWLTSIGVLRWRGNLPANEVPKEGWLSYLEATRAALRAWADRDSSADAEAERLHEALGESTPFGQAVVRDFLLADDRGGVEAWEWLEEYARREGLTARARLHAT